MRYGQKCLLCGRDYPAGLQVMGCLICFPCEKKLLGAVKGAVFPRAARLRLNRIYGGMRRDAETYHL